jgi:hypothetical protein
MRAALRSTSQPHDDRGPIGPRSKPSAPSAQPLQRPSKDPCRPTVPRLPRSINTRPLTHKTGSEGHPSPSPKSITITDSDTHLRHIYHLRAPAPPPASPLSSASLILSTEQYQALQAAHYRVGLAARKKAFEAEFGEWIAAQNARFEAHGIPGADLRPW